jgi:pimeloyl-ACP methyl ester carboxylesterase
VQRRLTLLALLWAGCFNRAADHCPGCAIVSRISAAPPARRPSPATGVRARVVLVGGGFGFGDEWRPVIAALRAAHADFYVYAWPFRDPPAQARGLVRLLQADLDRGGLDRLVIFAHSAGGMLAGWCVRQLRVPPGTQVLLAAIASGRDMNFAPYVPEERVNTPMGFAMGGDRRPVPPIPPGVTIVQYRTEDPPAQRSDEAHVEEVFLGARTGHDESVGKAAVPLVRSLFEPGAFWRR